MLFQNRRLVRAIACFFLLETIGSLAAPSAVWAMSGPSQPEYASYEASASTDLVRLSTGDFSYSIPMLDIPGPERSFSLPLTYKAGIQLDQEASWVGLGWSLNAGAIARSVNGYPDDADNEPSNLQFAKTIQNGRNRVIIPGIWNSTWNSNTGSAGSVNLLGLAGFNWDKDGLNGGDLLGITYKRGQGFDVDIVKVATAAISIATLGGGSVAAVALNVGLDLASTVAFATAVGAFGIGRQAGVSGFNNKPSLFEYGDYQDTFYRQHVTTNTTERRYGSLYFGNMSQAVEGNATTGPYLNAGGSNFQAPRFQASRDCDNLRGLNSTETAADVYQFGGLGNDGSEGYYESCRRPVSIAHDAYNVMGEAVSGTIRPYRLDVGSVAYPKLGRDECDKHYKYMVVPFLTGYKVPFRYEGSLSNEYDYHNSGAATGNATGLDVNAGLNTVMINDPRLRGNSRIESPRKGLSYANRQGPQLVQGKHTVWYSNQEIEQMAVGIANGYPNGFLNFEPPVSIAPIRIRDLFRHGLPPQGIGAFAVTSESGTTYHYSLPVYQFKTFSESLETLPVSFAGSSRGISKVLEGAPAPAGAQANPNYHGGYATTWLLTAITSPDYIDRNNSGTVDAGDWGGWVKFSYGKFSSRYKWRQPYIGSSYSDADEHIQYEGHTEGYKETYYLDRIATRTHTALFVKSVRKDARGHFRPNNPAPDVLNINDTRPASSLRLDEIILLDNATLAKLETVDGIRASNDPNPTPALSNDTNQNGGSDPISGDAINGVLDTGDLTTDARIKTFAEANTLKRIHFNYGYDLCRDTPNSFDYGPGLASPPMDEARASVGRQGKLTLKSVSFFGPTVAGTPSKIIPDFTFSYESATESLAETNPAYGKEKWDAFGMYSASGMHNTTSHKPSRYGPTAPWTLRKITSPLGGVTEVSYERDQYAHVSEYGTRRLTFTGSGTVLTLSNRRGFTGNLTDIVHPGDFLELTGSIGYACGYTSPTGGSYGQGRTVKYDKVRKRVASVTSTTITISQGFSVSCDNLTMLSTPSGRFEADLPDNLVGGDVRVSAITATNSESGDKYQTRYQYTVSGNQSSNSSGVLAKEPPFLDKSDHAFEQQYDYPATPVLYSQVSVMHGQFRNGNANDYTTREVYEFFTPSSNMIAEVPSERFNGFPNHYKVAFFNNRVTINTGLIGQPKAVRVYNGQGHQELSTSFGYANNVANADGIAGQGHFTEGAMTNEELDRSYHHTNRTTKEYIPAVLTSSRSTRNGVSIENTNELYDFYTGQVLSTAFTNSQGRRYHSITVPAYTLPAYAGMGPKSDGLENRHMLAQAAAAYTVLEVPGNPGYNVLDPLNTRTSSVLSASVKTWKNDWNNYRVVTTGGQYQDDATTQQPVWREQASYVWQSSLLKPDGSFGSFVNYNWNGTPDAHWVKASEALRYDHYSHGLENRDVNGLFTANKTGHDGTQTLASAANARYTEVAYSGAEDVPTLINGLKHFGGEVVSTGTKADGLQGTPVAHTGAYSIKLAAEENMRYRAVVGSEVLTDKPYRLSAWVNGGDLLANAGRLYASVNGTVLGQTSITAATTKKAGNWYRLALNVTVPAAYAGQVVEFGCSNTTPRPNTTSVYFDDFRVCPVAATMSSSVYDPRTNQREYSLDDENLFTRYEYNNVGRLLRVFRETFDHPNDNSPTSKLIKEYSYNFSQLHMPTWISTAYRCERGSTGYEERQVVDANPLNSPPSLAHWERNGPSAVCRPPECISTEQQPCSLYDTNNDGVLECVNATPEYLPCAPCRAANGQGLSPVTRWTFADGTTVTIEGACSDACLAQKSSDSSTEKKKSAKGPLPANKISPSKIFKP